MGQPVVAIGLDTADLSCIERWMRRGYLPNLRGLKSSGWFGVLHPVRTYADEATWTSLLTGCLPHATGFWSPLRFLPETYGVTDLESYRFEAFPPFYALAPSRNIAVFDVPHCGRLFPDMEGVQVLAWGTKDPMGPRQSKPSALISELVNLYGEHPAGEIKNRIAWWDDDFLLQIQAALLEGVTRRVKICRHLLGLGNWDFFLAVFSEAHIAHHHFWHLSESSHPLYPLKARADQDPLLAIYEAIDDAIGEILRTVPSQATVIVFSVDGGASNVTDLQSQLFLPEVLYRFSFPGQLIFPNEGTDSRPEAPILKLKTGDWLADIWRLKRGPVLEIPAVSKHPIHARQRLYKFVETALLWRWRFPYPRLGSLGWQPASWYRPYWPAMKAFALPTFGDGNVRINLKGREPQGIVDREAYPALCEELTTTLLDLRNPRTGEHLVRDVIRNRDHGLEQDSALPDADLAVIWEQTPADVVEHPSLGRIGPVPFRSTGGHRPAGFFLATGENFPAGQEVSGGGVVDLAPTVLDLLGVEPPAYLDGQSLLR